MPAKLRPWLPVEPLAEDAARGLVRRADPEVGLKRDHARGEPREHDREIGPLGLRHLLCCCWSSRATTQALGHVVEGVHEEAHLVVRGERQPRVEVALGDGARALHEVLDRLDETLRGEDRAVPGGEQRQQQHHRQRQDEARLERLAQVVLLAELLVGGLHGVCEGAEGAPATGRSPAPPCRRGPPRRRRAGTAVRIR